MKSHTTAARTFGVFFILAFLTYGTGSALIESIVSAPDMLANVYANQTLILIGAMLMAVIHTFLNIGLPVSLLAVLKPRHETLYFGYLSAAIAATTVLVVGVLFLLLLLPLSDEFMRAGAALPGQLEAMAMVLKKAGFFSYQMGMILWSLGGLMLCAILYQSQLVPRILSIVGIVGYVVFMSGCILEVFGMNLSLLHTLPGGLFEITLSLWLIVKGFNTSASAAQTAAIAREPMSLSNA